MGDWQCPIWNGTMCVQFYAPWCLDGQAPTSPRIGDNSHFLDYFKELLKYFLKDLCFVWNMFFFEFVWNFLRFFPFFFQYLFLSFFSFVFCILGLVIIKRLLLPVVPHKAVAEVSKIGNL